MEAYTVMDPVNKYRHGVLIGNFVEDQFGKELHERGPLPDAPKITNMKLTHTLKNSLHQHNEFISSQNNDSSQFYTTALSIRGQPYKRPEQSTSYNIFHHQQVNRNVPVIPNNPKREQRLEAEGKAYDLTRYQLANKFSRTNGQDPALEHLSQEIPDILTGQIFKAKPSLGSEVKVDQKGKTKIEQPVKTKSINPFGSYSVVKPQIQRFEEVQYAKFVYPHQKGEKRDILFGHGIALQDFQKRQLSTTYDLSFNQRVMPQTQINSFYNPDNKQSARQFNRETLYEKNHQPNIPAFGSSKGLSQEKASRPYQPYTATYDANHLKHEYLRK